MCCSCAQVSLCSTIVSINSHGGALHPHHMSCMQMHVIRVCDVSMCLRLCVCVVSCACVVYVPCSENIGFIYDLNLVQVGTFPVSTEGDDARHDHDVLMSCHVMPCHVMSCHAMLCHVMSCHVMSCHAMPCHAMRCDAMRCDAMHDAVYVYVCVMLKVGVSVTTAPHSSSPTVLTYCSLSIRR